VSDRELREARQRWLKTRAREHESDYLRVCLRVGCAPQIVRLLAHCGFAGAQDAAEVAAPDEDWETWTRGFEAFSETVLQRISVVCVTHALHTARRQPGVPPDVMAAGCSLAERTIASMRAFLAQPGEEQRSELDALALDAGMNLWRGSALNSDYPPVFEAAAFQLLGRQSVVAGFPAQWLFAMWSLGSAIGKEEARGALSAGVGSWAHQILPS
jgi:hypothetical protein